MQRLFSKLHITAAFSQSNALYSSRGLASVAPKRSSTAEIKPTAGYRGIPNGWTLFVKEKFQKGTLLKDQLGDLAKQWKAASATEKKKFNEEAGKLRKEAADAFHKLPQAEQEQKADDAKQAREDRKKYRTRNAYRRFRKETGCPKRPLTAFLQFSQEKYPSKSKDDIGENGKKAAEEFKNLSDEQKKVYTDKYQKELEAYKVEYQKWYQIHGPEYEALKAEHRGKPKKTKKAAASRDHGKRSQRGMYAQMKKRTTPAKKRGAPKKKTTTTEAAAGDAKSK